MELIEAILILGIFVALLIGVWLGSKIGSFRVNRKWELDLPNLRKDAVMKSRSILAGQFSEQLAPYLPDFNFNPSECKFIGKPIDFICFSGLDDKDKNEVDEIVFVEVKSGKSKLSKMEKSVKDAIESKKVRWEEYRIDEDLTKNKGDLEE